jgi:hypothetical protein
MKNGLQLQTKAIMTNLDLDNSKKIQETLTKLRGNLEDKSWEISDGFETIQTWNDRQDVLVSKLEQLVNECSREVLAAIITKRVFDGHYCSEKNTLFY